MVCAALLMLVLMPGMAAEGVRTFSPVFTNASKGFSLAQVGKSSSEIRKAFDKPEITKSGDWIYYESYGVGWNSEQVRRRFMFAKGRVAGVVTEARKVGCVAVQTLK